MGSPIESWEGATAIFTGADSPGSMVFWLIVAIALVVVPIVAAAVHENQSYTKYK